MSEAVSTSTLAPVLGQIRLWWEMSRPRVLLLVLFTGLPMLGMARDGWPSLGRALVVLLATGMAGAASSAFNAWWERDLDARMARTRNRPLPAAAMAPVQALGFGAAMTLLSTALLWGVGGGLAAAVGVATILFYVVVYTIWLKPRTPQNIVIGGAAGATAPLIVEAAADGRLTWASAILFLIVFLWTPPHFWAIAIFRREEYAAAGFPMMPVVVGDRATRRQSVVYTVLTVLASLALVPLGLLSPLYGLAALIAGAWFLVAVLRSVRADDPREDYRVFKVSIAYLFLVFGAMLADTVLRALLGPLVDTHPLLVPSLRWPLVI